MIKLSREEYLDLVDRELDAMKALIRQKNHDYTAGGGPFANFEDTGGLCTPLVGLLLRVGDKMQRLRTFAKAGKLQVQGEGAKDAARDLIGYSLIIIGMLHEEEKAIRPSIPSCRPLLPGVDETLQIVADVRAAREVSKNELSARIVSSPRGENPKRGGV